MNKKWYILATAFVGFYSITSYSSGTVTTGCSTCLQQQLQQYFNNLQICYENCIKNVKSGAITTQNCLAKCNAAPNPYTICQNQYTDCATAIAKGCNNCIEAGASFYQWVIGGTSDGGAHQMCEENHGGAVCDQLFSATSVNLVNICQGFGFQDCSQTNGSTPCLPVCSQTVIDGCTEQCKSSIMTTAVCQFACYRLNKCTLSPAPGCPTSTTTGTQQLVTQPTTRRTIR